MQRILLTGMFERSLTSSARTIVGKGTRPVTGRVDPATQDGGRSRG